MPWFDKGIHPEFRKSEDRANQKEAPVLSAEERIRQTLTTPQSLEDAAAMRESIQSGLAHAGSVLGGGLQAARTAGVIGAHLSSAAGAAAKQAAKEITSLPVVQQTAADLGREAGTRLSDAASRVANVRTTRGGLLGMNAARGIAGALPSRSTDESPESPSAASAPEVASSSEPGVLDVLLARVQSATSKPFARRRSGSLAREVVTGTQANDVPPEGDSYGTRVASVYNNAVNALTDYLLNQFKRTKREGATDLASLQAIGPTNVGRAVKDAVTGHVREAVEELGENVALSALETVLGPEEQELENFSDIYRKHPQYLNQHTHLEILPHKDEHGAQYVRNPLTGRMGKIVEITHPEQENIGPVIEGMFHDSISPQPRKGRFVLSWLDGHPSNDWIHPEVANYIRVPAFSESPFGPLPRRQWTPVDPDAIGSGTSGLQEWNDEHGDWIQAHKQATANISKFRDDPSAADHNKRIAYQSLKDKYERSPESVGFGRVPYRPFAPTEEEIAKEIERIREKDIRFETEKILKQDKKKKGVKREFTEPSKEQIERAAGPIGWTMPGVSQSNGDALDQYEDPLPYTRIISAPHSPKERERYLAENMEATKRGAIVRDPRQRRSFDGVNSGTKYTRSHARLTHAQQTILSEPELVQWFSDWNKSGVSIPDAELTQFRAQKWSSLVDALKGDYPAPEGVTDQEWTQSLKANPWRAAHHAVGERNPGTDANSWQEKALAAKDSIIRRERNFRDSHEKAGAAGKVMENALARPYGDKRSTENFAKELFHSIRLFHDAPTEDNAKYWSDELDRIFQDVNGNGRGHGMATDLDGVQSVDRKVHKLTSLGIRDRVEGLTDVDSSVSVNRRPKKYMRNGPFGRDWNVDMYGGNEDEARKDANEQWPYPDDYSHQYDGEPEYRHWEPDKYGNLDESPYYDRNFSGTENRTTRTVAEALNTIQGNNPVFDDKDAELITRAIRTPHFEEHDAMFANDAHHHAFFSGLRAAREHQEDTNRGEDPARDFLADAHHHHLRGDQLGVALTKHAPELLRNRIKLLQARISEIKKHNQSVDSSGAATYDPYNGSHAYPDSFITMNQKELRATLALLDKFKSMRKVKNMDWQNMSERPYEMSPGTRRYDPTTGLYESEGAPAVKSFFHLTRTSALRKSMESKIRDEENQQRRKIHREEIDEEEHGVEHEYDHGQARHEKRVMGIVKDAEDKTIWQRMDRYTRKELDAIEKEENAQAKRIHKDHTGPGVPQFVAKYDHGIQKHKKKMKKEILELREEEKEEVKKDIAKSLRKLQKAVNAVDMSPDLLPATPMKPPVTPKLPKASAVPTTPVMKSTEPMEKSRKHKKKKSKWPSFDVQSSEIARREGVSEEDADAMLASRARNHGTKKSLTGKVDENGFVIPGTVQRRSNVGFADMDRRASEIKARADAARVLAAADAAAATPVVPSGPRIRYGDPITETIAGARGKLAAREAGGTLAGREIRVYRPSAKKKRT